LNNSNWVPVNIDETLRKVDKKYRKNVATADALTGLLNKGGFMTALKQLVMNQIF
tara:strand:- start:84 stop:248 length:165 start_codon:yes stop_codon:yes gene_type:complete